MKILKIEFQNINSLRGNHSIDFTIEPFKTNALFAITGPTGSGKSTILDVIALALFNQIPRLGKISLREIISKGAILTRNQKEAMARVSYASKNGNFSSTWSISTNRNGNLRDYDMELRNTDSGQLLDLKKSEIPSKNEELIGLNYNQFIKSVLLAQGEFAQFLQAKKDDRGALLEKITGTGIYRRLGQLAFERHKLENQDIKTQQDVIAIKTAELLDPEVAKNHQSELQKYQEKLQPLSDKIEQLQKKISLKEAINKQEKEISAITLQQENAAKKFRFFVENQGKSLENHEKLEPFSTQITQRAQFINNHEELLTDQQLSITNQEKIAHDKISLLSEINALIKKEPKSDEIIDSLQDFAANVDRLQREKQDKLKMYSALKEQAQSILGEINYTLDKDVSNDIFPIENSLEQSKNGLKSLKIDLKSVNLDSVDEEKKRLRTEIKNLNLTNGIKENIESITSIIDKTALKQENLTNQLKTLPKEIELSAANSERYDQEREKLKIQQQNERLQASLSDHRKQLHDGKPCPLCGSLEHPFDEKNPGIINKLDEQLKQAEKNYSLWNKKNIQELAQLKQLQGEYNNLDLELSDNKNEIAALEKKLEEYYEDYKRKTADQLLHEISIKEQQIEKIEDYEKANRNYNSLERTLPLLKKMVNIAKEGTALRKEIVALYGGPDIYKETQNIQNRWISIVENEKNELKKAKELKEKLAQNNLNIQNIDQKLLPAIQRLGFQSFKIAEESLLKHTDYLQLRQEQENLKKEISSLATTLTILEKQLLNDKENDEEESIEQLGQNLLKSKEDLASLRQTCEELKHLLKNDNDRHQQIEELQLKIKAKEKQIRRWRILNELIGDANGKRFNEFAQHLTLTQLLRLANTRLKDLSDRYRLDTPTDDEDDSLVTIDQHMGGQRRSVKTLSGGETFILSLSMALALSDLASRNVAINSLFIDEGFGTLDPETLDQTLDTLERLQASSSKTIGIISHVDSLKERIATQIQLKRNGQGYSTLHIK